MQLARNKSVYDYEQQLAKHNKKTNNLAKFMRYYKLKWNLKHQIDMNDTYNDYLLKLNWFSYINTQRHETTIINELKKNYGNDAVIIAGDWSAKTSQKHFISTPSLGFKRRLSKDFTVHLIDEYKTSQLNHKTLLPQKNLEISGKKLHAVLTFKLGQRKACINRDKNAVLNMKAITLNLIQKGKRPKEFIKTPYLTDLSFNLKRQVRQLDSSPVVKNNRVPVRAVKKVVAKPKIKPKKKRTTIRLNQKKIAQRLN